MDIIRIKDLNFKYKDKEIFTNLNLTIEGCKWYSIIGSNGSGKSTLVKLLSGLIRSNNIFVDNMEVSASNLYDIRKIMSIVFEDPNTNLICETVREELTFPLENIGIIDTKTEVEKMAKLFNITDILDNSIIELTNKEKQIVALSSALIIKPKILILDESFVYLESVKDSIFDILKQLNITVINITHDMEETLIGDNIIILNNGKILINDEIKQVYPKEELFKEANLSLPFIIDLSNKLKYYSLIDKTYYNMKDLVDDLWN